MVPLFLKYGYNGATMLAAKRLFRILKPVTIIGLMSMQLIWVAFYQSKSGKYLKNMTPNCTTLLEIGSTFPIEIPKFSIGGNVHNGAIYRSRSN